MRHEFASAAALPPGFWRWPHVNPAREWACKYSGTLVVDEDFLDLFEELRGQFGRPLVITSGYRSPEHNAVVSDTGDSGPHTTGRAVDVRVYGTPAFELVRLALDLGFTGLGFGQDLKLRADRRYIHLDTLTAADGFPMRPNLWSY